MKKIITFILTLILAVCCAVTQPTVQPINNQTNIKDSIAIHWVDSVRYIPKEVIKDIVPQYDSLIMETSMAKSVSYVDTTTHTLKGLLTNKKGIEYKYIYKDRIEYRDSIQIKEVPVPVEVEKIVVKSPWYQFILWIFSIIGLISTVIAAIKIYLKFHGVK